MVLFQNKIPFHYEEVLWLDENAVYPDFTIRHPKTGKYYYWEHFGHMDNPEYRQTTCLKMTSYILNGIYPGEQLITTYETKEMPLSLDSVEKIVNEKFK